jgi:integrase
VFNKKTDFFNKNENDEYRKIPLHPFIIENLKSYIQGMGKERTDYLFGVPKMNEDTKQLDGHLHQTHFRKAIIEFYKRIKIMAKLQETGDFKKALSINIAELENEMKEKRIVFYSLRHTFQTLLATKYKGQALLIDYLMGHRPIQTMLASQVPPA